MHEINLSEASGFGENSTLLEINWNISDVPPQVYERKNELPVERLDVKNILLRTNGPVFSYWFSHSGQRNPLFEEIVCT